ncbi:replication-associated protein [Capybara virus 13_cap1_257]|nr:replication-associated protein [Capybara virus 13_cap1_257]
MAARSSAIKNWVFTLNNPSEDFEARLLETLEANANFKFVAGQREIAPTTGTEHFQGLVVLEEKKRLSWLREFFSDTAHFEVMRGRIPQALAYCTKEETRKPHYEPITWGEQPQNAQGKRNDLDAVKALIDSGASESTIAEEHFSSWVRHHKGFREYKRMKITPRDWKTEVWVIIGPTGTGKSRAAAASQENPSQLYYKQAHTDWWDGYDGQETVILDDFYGWVRYDEMLRLMDRYPMLVQIKGGQTQFLAKTIVLTSNTMPSSWYPKIAASTAGMSAFFRRVTRWTFLGNHVSMHANSYEEFDEKIQSTPDVPDE